MGLDRERFTLDRQICVIALSDSLPPDTTLSPAPLPEVEG